VSEALFQAALQKALDTIPRGPIKYSPVFLIIDRVNWEILAMPVYEFECSCGHVFEALVPMDTGTRECPKCSQKAKKILSSCSFELKGGGWFADGYSSKKN
jgi:putative FmdB family regulatory protein